MNIRSIVPDIWLLIFIVGLPQFSETVYTPSLPDIARSLMTSEALVEYTLTIYLFGFAVGTLLWGKLSDKVGRKSALLAGFFIYFLGCVGCYNSETIIALMMSRFIQAFGGSAGSVLGQVICRDVFTGSDLGKVFSMIGAGLALAPATGPVLGGLIDQYFGWSAIFIALIFFCLILIALIMWRLPETYTPTKFSFSLIKDTFFIMIHDRKVLAFGYLVGACNGICFSYYAEGSFCLINFLNMSPSSFGSTFMLFALTGLIGSYLSKTMHDMGTHGLVIIYKGISLMALGALFLTTSTITLHSFAAAFFWFIVCIVVSMVIIMLGMAMAIPNLLSLALQNYPAHIRGTASSLFGFYYYSLIAFFTLGMGLLHNATLYPMPFYFLGIAISMQFVYRFVLCEKLKTIL